MFFYEPVVDKGSASAAGVLGTLSFVVGMIMYAVYLFLLTRSDPIPIETTVQGETGYCEAVNGLSFARSPLGYLIRGHGESTIAANPWLPTSDQDSLISNSTEESSYVLGYTSNGLLARYSRDFPVSGTIGVSSAASTLGGSADEIEIKLCRGRREFLEVQPVRAPLEIEEKSDVFSLAFLSADLTSAAYLSNSPDYPHRLADLSVTPPVVTAEVDYFDFKPSSVNVEAKNMLESQDGTPAVWMLEDATSFAAGSREVDVDPYARSSEWADESWNAANETILTNANLGSDDSVQVIVQCKFVDTQDPGEKMATTRAFGLNRRTAEIIWQYLPDSEVVPDAVVHSMGCPSVRPNAARDVLQIASVLIDRTTTGAESNDPDRPGLSGPRLLRLNANNGGVLADVVIARDAGPAASSIQASNPASRRAAADPNNEAWPASQVDDIGWEAFEVSMHLPRSSSPQGGGSSGDGGDSGDTEDDYGSYGQQDDIGWFDDDPGFWGADDDTSSGFGGDDWSGYGSGSGSGSQSCTAADLASPTITSVQQDGDRVILYFSASSTPSKCGAVDMARITAYRDDGIFLDTLLLEDYEVTENLNVNDGFTSLPRSALQDNGFDVYFYLSVQHSTLWSWSPYGILPSASIKLTGSAGSGSGSGGTGDDNGSTQDDNTFGWGGDDDDTTGSGSGGDDDDNSYGNNDDGNSGSASCNAVPSITNVQIVGSNVRLTFTSPSTCGTVQDVRVDAYRDDGVFSDTRLINQVSYSRGLDAANRQVDIPASQLDNQGYDVYFYIELRYASGWTGQSSYSASIAVPAGTGSDDDDDGGDDDSGGSGGGSTPSATATSSPIISPAASSPAYASSSPSGAESNSPAASDSPAASSPAYASTSPSATASSGPAASESPAPSSSASSSANCDGAPSVTNVQIVGSNVRLTFTSTSACGTIQDVRVDAYRDDGVFSDTRLINQVSFSSGLDAANRQVDIPASQLDDQGYDVYFYIELRYASGWTGQSSYSASISVNNNRRLRKSGGRHQIASKRARSATSSGLSKRRRLDAQRTSPPTPPSHSMRAPRPGFHPPSDGLVWVQLDYKPDLFKHLVRLVLLDLSSGQIVSDFRSESDGLHTGDLTEDGQSQQVAWTFHDDIFESSVHLIEGGSALLVQQRANIELSELYGLLRRSEELRLVRIDAGTGAVTADLMTNRVRPGPVVPVASTVDLDHGNQTWTADIGRDTAPIIASDYEVDLRRASNGLPFVIVGSGSTSFNQRMPRGQVARLQFYRLLSARLTYSGEQVLSDFYSGSSHVDDTTEGLWNINERPALPIANGFCAVPDDDLEAPFPAGKAPMDYTVTFEFDPKEQVYEMEGCGALPKDAYGGITVPASGLVVQQAGGSLSPVLSQRDTDGCQPGRVNYIGTRYVYFDPTLARATAEFRTQTHAANPSSWSQDLCQGEQVAAGYVVPLRDPIQQTVTMIKWIEESAIVQSKPLDPPVDGSSSRNVYSGSNLQVQTAHLQGRFPETAGYTIVRTDGVHDPLSTVAFWLGIRDQDDCLIRLVQSDFPGFGVPILSRFKPRSTPIQEADEADVSVVYPYRMSVEDFGMSLYRNLTCTWPGIQASASTTTSKEVDCGGSRPCLAYHYDENRVEVVGGALMALIDFEANVLERNPGEFNRDGTLRRSDNWPPSGWSPDSASGTGGSNGGSDDDFVAPTPSATPSAAPTPGTSPSASPTPSPTPSPGAQLACSSIGRPTVTGLYYNSDALYISFDPSSSDATACQSVDNALVSVYARGIFYDVKMGDDVQAVVLSDNRLAVQWSKLDASDVWVTSNAYMYFTVKYSRDLYSGYGPASFFSSDFTVNIPSTSRRLHAQAKPTRLEVDGEVVGSSDSRTALLTNPSKNLPYGERHLGYESVLRQRRTSSSDRTNDDIFFVFAGDLTDNQKALVLERTVAYFTVAVVPWETSDNEPVLAIEYGDVSVALVPYYELEDRIQRERRRDEDSISYGYFYYGPLTDGLPIDRVTEISPSRTSGWVTPDSRESGAKPYFYKWRRRRAQEQAGQETDAGADLADLGGQALLSSIRQRVIAMSGGQLSGCSAATEMHLSVGYAGTLPSDVSSVALRESASTTGTARWYMISCRGRHIASVRFDLATNRIDSITSEASDVRIGGAGALRDVARMLPVESTSGSMLYFDKEGNSLGVFEIVPVQDSKESLPTALKEDLQEASVESHELTLLQVLPRTDEYVGIGDVLAGSQTASVVSVGQGEMVLPQAVAQGVGVYFEASVRVITTIEADPPFRQTKEGRIVPAELDRAPCHDPSTEHCLQFNLAMESTVVQYEYPNTMLAAVGTLGGFASTLLGGLGVAVAACKAMGAAGKRVEADKALIVGRIIENDDDDTMIRVVARINREHREAAEAEKERRAAQSRTKPGWMQSIRRVASFGSETDTVGDSTAPLAGGPRVDMGHRKSMEFMKRNPIASGSEYIREQKQRGTTTDP